MKSIANLLMTLKQITGLEIFGDIAQPIYNLINKKVEIENQILDKKSQLEMAKRDVQNVKKSIPKKKAS